MLFPAFLVPFTSQLFSLAPRLCRGFVNRAASRPIPPPNVTPGTESIANPRDFLKAIGRSSETKVQTEKWEDFWKTTGIDLKKAGLGVRDRRYILWCMEKYRLGQKIQDFAHEAKKKKTVRGWGPAVQNGKRIRSRRIKN